MRGEITSPKHKSRVQIIFGNRVELAHKLFQSFSKILSAQIRRVCDQGRVAAILEDLAHVGGAQPLLTVRTAQQLLPLPGVDAARDLAEQGGGTHGHADERSVGVGMVELFNQLGHAEGDSISGGIRDFCGAQLIEFHGLDVNNPGPAPRGLAIPLTLALDAPQETRIMLDGLHRQGEGGKLHRAPIHVRTVQVLLQDQASDLSGRVSGLDVHVPQDVEGIGEHVSRTAGRVDDAEVLGVGDRQTLVLLALGRGHQILKTLPERRVRVSTQPLRPQRILHQVAHHPVRGKELCDGSQRVLVNLDTCVVDFLLTSGDVKLIEPANDLNVHVSRIVGADRRHDIGTHRLTSRQQVRRWNQVRPVVRLGKYARHDPVPGGEVLAEQQDVCIKVLIIEEQLRCPHSRVLSDVAIEVAPTSALHALGYTRPRSLGWGDDSVVARDPHRIHVAQGRQAVEPRVGDHLRGTQHPVTTGLSMLVDSLGQARTVGVAQKRIGHLALDRRHRHLDEALARGGRQRLQR